MKADLQTHKANGNKSASFFGKSEANAAFFQPAVIQPQLTINEPGDKYEQEADAMAERVMRMETAGGAPTDEEQPIQTMPLAISRLQRQESEEAEPVQMMPLSIQRKCAECEQEEQVQRQEMPEDETIQTKGLSIQRQQASPEEEMMQTMPLAIQRKCAACEAGEGEPVQTMPLMRKSENGGYQATPRLSSQLSQSKGGGSSLPVPTLNHMNQAFGADFSNVRVHTGSQAQEMSQGIQAKAFTNGSDVYFNQGQYSPESSEGKKLLAHELTHVVQQGGIKTKKIQKNPNRDRNTISVNVKVQVYRIMSREDFIIYYLKIEYGYGVDEAKEIISKQPDRFKGSWTVTEADVANTFILVEKIRSTTDFIEDTASKTVGGLRGEDGRREGFDERKSIFNGLPGATKTAINEEADKRYWERTNIKVGEKIKKGEEGNAEAWLDIRDELMIQHEMLQALPEKVKKFMVFQTGGIDFNPESYEQLVRIAQKIMSMSEADVDAYLSMSLRVTTDLNEFEQSINNFLENGTPGNDGIEDPVFEPTDASLDATEAGDQVELYGVVQMDPGSRLWAQPNKTSASLGVLPLNTKVFVDRNMGNGWLEVYVERHQQDEALPVTEGTQGYLEKSHISTDMPDPGAWLFRIIKTGQGALELAAEVYQHNFKPKWGKDYRYLVNVLVAVNEAKNRRFLYKDSQGDSWDKAKTKKSGQIWIPGMELVDAMHGQLSSGSITYEIISTLKDIVIGVAAFIVGLLQGALGSIIDVFVGAKDLIVMAKDVLVSLLFKENIIEDAKTFYEQISQIKMSDIIEMLGKKWNHPDTWERWKFRGYVIGYAIMEVLMLIFSAGAVTAIKWAGKVSKVGKLIEYLSKLPKVEKFIKGAQALTGEKIAKIKAFLKAAGTISESHGWAAKVLRIPMHILKRLSEIDIGNLKKLPQWARERFTRLSEKAMLRLLGCHSPCKVNIHEIEAALKLATKAGNKLDMPDDVIKALRALPNSSELNLRKISSKLRKKDSALMTAIKEAGLTDTDFAKLADFLTPGDINPAQAYRTFTRYLTAVVPAKTGDVKRLNEILAAIVKSEPRRGAALKGAMFEQWVALHVPELSSLTFKRITFDLWSLIRKKTPPHSRTVDKWVTDSTGGTIWDMKHQFSKVPDDQASDYLKLLGKTAPDGNTVKGVNYLFPDKATAELNKHLKTSYGFEVFYIDEVANKLTMLP